MNKRNLWLDLFKIFLAWLVICIHFVYENYSYYPLYRLAVPMFFMISGYFVYTNDSNKLLEKAKISIKRSFKYMLIGFGIYIIYDFVMCYINGNGVGYYFTTLFYQRFIFEFVFLNQPITYSGYQLWFLIALFVISITHYLIIKYQKQKYYYFIIPFGILIYLFFSGYMHLFQYTDMPIRYTRNAWFFGLPLFGIGFNLAKFNFHKKNWYKYIYLILGLFFFFFQIKESELVVMEMYVSTILASIFLLEFFLGLKSPKADWFYKWFGKNISFYIYIFHVAVGLTINRLFNIENLNLKSLIILIISFSIYEICHLVHKLYSYLLIKYKEKRLA